MKLKLPRLRASRPQRTVEPPKRVIGGGRLDPARIEAARERLRRDIPPRPGDE